MNNYSTVLDKIRPLKLFNEFYKEDFSLFGYQTKDLDTLNKEYSLIKENKLKKWLKIKMS